ncbi:MAG TPA: 30S ribosomal protein S20 [Candidatus Dormibacteraeota bacterium]|nr:30S ribosomal protein S20 [Candidatus Dormibacteraeota bacterium]
MAKRTASAKKQVRAGVRRAARNRGVKSEVKTLVVKARKSLVGSPVAESERHALTLEAVRALDRAASKGILHRNNAARRKARLTKLMAKVAIASPAPAGQTVRGKKGATAAAPAAPVAAKPASKPAASKKK